MQPDPKHVFFFNKIIHYLARRDISNLTPEELLLKFNIPQADLLILLGNSSLFVAEQAAKAYKVGLAKELMICGGMGHSTLYLAGNVRQHPTYAAIEVSNKSEATILKDILTSFWGIDASEVILENQSTNCGANAAEAFKLLTGLGKNPQRIILLQDPVLQRRSDASFKKLWLGSEVQFISYAAFIPILTLEAGMITYADKSHFEFCNIDRLLSLVMGEVPRLQNNHDGYGPKGKGFITAVDIPTEVLAAYQELAAFYPNLIRT